MIRTFLAIELPGKITEDLGREQTGWKPLAPKIKWVRPDGIHLTLKFLGEIPRQRVRQVITAARACCSRHHTFVLNFKGTGVFPTPRRPRVLWIVVAGDLYAIRNLHADMESVMEEAGFARETREFRPHLTLARIKGTSSRDFIREFLRAGISLGPVEVTAVTVFQSRLSPAGAEYIPLARCPLVPMSDH